MQEGNNFELSLTIDDKLKVKPDTRTLIVALKGEDFTNEEDAKRDALEKTGKVLDYIKSIMGVSDKSITVKTARIRPTYKQVQVNKKTKEGTVNREWYSEIVGYEYSASVSVMTNLNDEYANGVWKSLLKCDDAADVTPIYSIADIAPYEDELLKKIMEKAYRTANIIATSTNSKVLYVKDIDKSVHRLDVTYKGTSKSVMHNACLDSADMSFDCNIDSVIDDIVEAGENETREISDSLNITFVLGNK